jgi:DNA-binding response OmpR family regulator
VTAQNGGVLIVEDDEALRRILARQLRASGRTVVEAASAEQAGRLLEDGVRPGVVLLDLNLPGETGWDFLRGPALARVGSPPVLVSSATTVSPKRLAEFGVAGYLPKPCPMDTILDAVSRLLDEDRARRQP